jgi:hypothetical protein
VELRLAGHLIKSRRGEKEKADKKTKEEYN